MVDMHPTSWRIVFFGTPAFAVPSLCALIESPHTVVGVVTQPDKPRGRGQHVTQSPVKQTAITHGIPVLQPNRLKNESALADIQAFGADLGVVAAYGKILPAAVLAAPTHGLINVHASLLPKYRGAAPVHRAVMAGETETGISIMHVVQALDAGAVYATATRPIGPDDTSGEVEDDLARIGADLLMDVIAGMTAGRARAVPQDDAASTYAARLQKDEGVIDWTASAVGIHNRVRGLQPWPLTWTFLGGKRLIILKTRVGSAEAGAALPGTICAVGRDAVSVATGAGVVDVLTVQPEGRRAMAAWDFVAGHRLVSGTRFDPALPEPA